MQVKKLATWALLAFIAFFLFTRPAAAASAVNGVFDTVTTGADRLATFFTKVLT